MNFTQEPPELENQFESDRVLKSYLKRTLSDETFSEVSDEFTELGELVAGDLLELKMDDQENEPSLTQWDAWGNRVDRIEKTDVWKRARIESLRFGLVATAYEREYGELSRAIQFAKIYLFEPSADTYTCPLAMTDGATKTILESGNQSLIDRVVPKLTSRNPDEFWTSGQWMTETTGGSDVGRSNTEARKENGTWRLYGRKWFTSAAASDMALTLARPDGNPEGGEGLALFFVKTRDEDGSLNNIKINRLKDKLGTRKLPTAELELTGTPAIPVDGLKDGVKKISPMLNITRTWNAVSSLGAMRRGIALARDYARKRTVFGEPLSEKSLHQETMADLQAEYEAGFHLTFRSVELLGKEETETLDSREEGLLRALTPIIKLMTAKQAVSVSSEVLEIFGGAGYVEDTGIPVLLRDSQVLPIWEGTTNVLSLDFLRSLQNEEHLSALSREVDRVIGTLSNSRVMEVAETGQKVFDDAMDWLEATFMEDDQKLKAGARHFAMTIGRSLALLQLCEQAEWSLGVQNDARPLAAAKRFRSKGINKIRSISRTEAEALANNTQLTDEPESESESLLV